MGKDIFAKVYRLTRQIPRGKVTTYGCIAKILAINPQLVGWALHANKDPKTPCHRVVNREGKLAKSFAFFGEKEQKRRLAAEGIEFRKTDKVDLNKYFWDFS